MWPAIAEDTFSNISVHDILIIPKSYKMMILIFAWETRKKVSAKNIHYFYTKLNLNMSMKNINENLLSLQAGKRE
jgi:hypothetical protein